MGRLGDFMVLVVVVCVALVLAAGTTTAEQSRAGREVKGRSEDLMNGRLKEDREGRLVEVLEVDNDDDEEEEDDSEEEDGMESLRGGKCNSKETPCSQELLGKCRRKGDTRRAGYAVRKGCTEKCPYCYLRCVTNSINTTCSESGGTCRGFCIKKEFELTFPIKACFHEGCKCCAKCGNGSTECEMDGGFCRGDAEACMRRNRYQSNSTCVDGSCVCCKPCEPQGRCAELGGYCTSESSCRAGFMEYPGDCTSTNCICCARASRSEKSKSGQ